MDPNAALTEIRGILARDDLELPDYERLAELVAGLDEWMSKDGFLPDAWLSKPTLPCPEPCLPCTSGNGKCDWL